MTMKKGKRKIGRKLLSALLIMTMLLGSMSTSAFAADLTENTVADETAAQPESDSQPETTEEIVSTPNAVPEATQPDNEGTVSTPEPVPEATQPGNEGTVSTP